MDKGHSSAPTAILCCTLVPSWGWEGRARRAQGAGRAGERGERTHAHHLPANKAGSPSVKSAEKRGPRWGRSSQSQAPAFFSARKTL